MPSLARQSFSVSIIVAAGVITAQNFALQYWDVINTVVPILWLRLALAAGLTSVLYRLAMGLYKRHAWRWFNNEFVLAGHWEHRLNPTDKTPNGDRLGTFEVLQTPFEIRFACGENYTESGELTSHWKSLAVSDDELASRRLWVMYEIVRVGSAGAGGETDTDRGILQIDLHLDSSDRVTMLSGIYWDAGQSRHKGHFKAKRVATKAISAAETLTTTSS